MQNIQIFTICRICRIFRICKYSAYSEYSKYAEYADRLKQSTPESIVPSANVSLKNKTINTNDDVWSDQSFESRWHYNPATSACHQFTYGGCEGNKNNFRTGGHKRLIEKPDRVAELGSLSSGAKMAMKIIVKRVFTIFASNASFLRVIANLQN